jgi:small-conductance mechanosensitive channel
LRVSRNSTWRITAVAALVLLSIVPAGAQEETPEPVAAGEAATPGVAARPEPAVIPQTALLARGDETGALLARVSELVVADPAIVAIDAAVLLESETLNRKRAELDQLSQRTVSERTLVDQRERWQRSQVRLDDWRETLQARLQQLIELNDAVQFEFSTWTLTRDSIIEADVAEELVNSANALLAGIEAARAELTPRIEANVELMNRIGRRTDLVDEALAEIDDLQAQIRQRMFRRDAPPLWATPILGADVVIGEVRVAGAYWWKTLVDWTAAHYDQVLLFLIVFLVYLAAAGALRRWRRSWPDADRLRGAAFVASRPIATAGLATLGTGVFILAPMTGPVQDTFRLLAVLAVLRLGSGLGAPVPKRVFHGLMALYLLDTVVGFIPDGALFARFLELLMAVGGTALAIHAWRRWPVEQGWIWKIGRGLMAVAAFALSFGGIAGVLGWVDLGQTLVRGVVMGSLAAFAWMLLLHALAALLPLAQIGVVGETLSSLRESGDQFERAVMVPATLVAMAGWADGTLRSFRVEEPFWAAVDAVLSASLRVGNLEISARGVLSAIAILVVTTFVARIVRFVLSEEVFPRLVMRPGTKSTLVSLINYVIIAIGVVMAATAAGFNATQLTVLIGAMSVGIGFGLQAVVGNFVSGLILMFERPVAVGDQVEAGGFLGKITHIGIRASRVATFDGSDVIIPNSELVTKQVRNWTLTNNTKRINLDLSVGLESDPRQVLEIMTAAAIENDLVLDDPPPRSLMMGYGDSSINFRLQAWLQIENALAVPSALHQTLIERLRAAGIEVPAVRRERHQGD